MAKITRLPDDFETVNADLRQLAVWVAYFATKDAFADGAVAGRRSNMTTGKWRSTAADDSTKRFIGLEQTFLKDFEKYMEYFPGLTEYSAKEKMKLSAELLLYCTPDSISLQLTSEGSIYYTVRKNDISIYFDYYLVDEFDGKDDAIVSIFKKDEKLLDFGGTLDETILQLSKVLGPESIAFPAFA